MRGCFFFLFTTKSQKKVWNRTARNTRQASDGTFPVSTNPCKRNENNDFNSTICYHGGNPPLGGYGGLGFPLSDGTAFRSIV